MGVTDAGVAAESDSEDNRNLGMRRDSERFLVGSDGSIYYTPDHYDTFIKIQ